MAEKFIDIDGEALFKVVEALKNTPKEIRPAIAHAINRTVDSTTTQVKKEIMSEYTIGQKYILGNKKQGIEGAIKKHKATVKNFSGSIEAGGSQVALYKFKHTPKEPPKSLGWGVNSYRQPVKAQVKKSGGKKVVTYGKEKYKAFIVRRNEQNMIFVRTSDNRLPIKKLFALSVPQMIADKNESKASIKRIKDRAQEMLEKNVEQEINYRMLKLGREATKGKGK